MKKHLAILLAAALLLCAAPLAGFSAIELPEIDFGSIFTVPAKAAEIVDSGTCGEVDEEKGLDGSQVTWTLDSDGLLTIGGAGAIKDYELGLPPWYDNPAVNSVLIRNTVTDIGVNAFSSCTRLTTLTIPNSVTRIGKRAFDGCTELTEFTVPAGVTRIGPGVLANCPKLTKITVAPGNPTFFCSGNCLIIKNSKMLLAGCRNSVIPSDGSVTTIGGFAFRGCEMLTSVVIPEGVTRIGEQAFSDCAELTSVTLPNSLTTIEEDAFAFCGKLTSITVPDSVTRISMSAIPESTAIYGSAGSYAQQWAKKNDRTFKLIGDVDGNGKVESADARLALRASVKLEPAIVKGSAAYTAADYNKDGTVKSDDARAILRVSVKLDPYA